MTYALTLRSVRKRYGKKVALDGLDLQVPQGAMMGLVGPNGAGKTTTFGIISGALQADAGEVDILGRGPFDPHRDAGLLGLVPQDCELSPDSSAQQLLTYFGRLQGLSIQAARSECDRVLSLFRLTDRADARVKELSHGMKRRLAVAQALLGDPELVLLDEPTGGLDPHLVVEMRELLRQQRGQRTVVISSHILTDLEQTCDHIAFLEDGRCVHVGPLADVRHRSRRVRLVLARTVDETVLREAMAERDFEVVDKRMSYSLAAEEDAEEVVPRTLASLLAKGVPVMEVSVGSSLEEAYLEARQAHLGGM